MEKYRYGTITPVHGDWFIVQVCKEGRLCGRYILVGRNELTHILVNGVSQFIEDTQIQMYMSKRSIIRKYSKEPAYAHIFTDKKWYIMEA